MLCLAFPFGSSLKEHGKTPGWAAVRVFAESDTTGRLKDNSFNSHTTLGVSDVSPFTEGERRQRKYPRSPNCLNTASRGRDCISAWAHLVPMRSALDPEPVLVERSSGQCPGPPARLVCRWPLLFVPGMPPPSPCQPSPS